MEWKASCVSVIILLYSLKIINSDILVIFFVTEHMTSFEQIDAIGCDLTH